MHTPCQLPRSHMLTRCHRHARIFAVQAESRVHILGSFANIKMARDAICALILGSPISKVYTNLRGAANRLNHKI